MQTYRDIPITRDARGDYAVNLAGEILSGNLLSDVRLIVDEVLAASFDYRGILCAPKAGPEHGINDAEGYRFVVGGRVYFVSLETEDDAANREACMAIIDRVLV